MKKLGLLVMPMLVIPFLMSCSGKKTITVNKCDVSDSISLLSNEEKNLLKSFNSNKVSNEADSGLLKRTIDQVVPVSFLDTDGNKVEFTYTYAKYVDKQYIYVDAFINPNLPGKHLFVNVNTDEVKEIDFQTYPQFSEYSEAPFVKNCYSNQNGDYYFITYRHADDADWKGIGHFDNKFNLIDHYELPSEYTYQKYMAGREESEPFEWFNVNSKGEIVIQGYKNIGYEGLLYSYDKNLFYVGTDEVAKSFPLPYEVENGRFGNDKIFLGLDDKFYFFQAPYFNNSGQTRERIRGAALYQIDFTKSERNIYQEIWSLPEIESEFMDLNFYSTENKQVIVASYPGHGGVDYDSYPHLYLTLNYSNKEFSNVTTKDITYSFAIHHHFQYNNAIYVQKSENIPGTEEFKHSIYTIDLDTFEMSSTPVINLQETIGYLSNCGISRDNKTLSILWFKSIKDAVRHYESISYDLSEKDPKPNIVEINDNRTFIFMPL